MTKPLPCPFCGQQPKSEDNGVAFDAIDLYCDRHPIEVRTTTKGSYTQAMEVWNKRK